MGHYICTPKLGFAYSHPSPKLTLSYPHPSCGKDGLRFLANKILNVTFWVNTMYWPFREY